MNRMNNQQLLHCAMDIGEEMLRCGAEVSRVEDTVERIGLAYGAQRVDVFTITSSMVATLWRNGEAVTQTRRIREHATDFERLLRLNALSREICSTQLDFAEVQNGLFMAVAEPPTPEWMKSLAFMLIASSFCVFFGGSAVDALVSGVIGLSLKRLMTATRKIRLNTVVTNGALAFIGGLIALFLLHLNIGEHYDKIVIGDIMLLIPGIALTHSFCDMIGGDLISGMQRFCEALLSSAVIAVGFAFAQRLFV